MRSFLRAVSLLFSDSKAVHVLVQQPFRINVFDKAQRSEYPARVRSLWKRTSERFP